MLHTEKSILPFLDGSSTPWIIHIMDHPEDGSSITFTKMIINTRKLTKI
jgi:hypothetical protein